MHVALNKSIRREDMKVQTKSLLYYAHNKVESSLGTFIFPAFFIFPSPFYFILNTQNIAVLLSNNHLISANSYH